MITIGSLLLVGGTQKNCGKTTVACEIIKQFSKTHPVIGIKITLHPPDTNKPQNNKNNYTITEENRAGDATDTQRMLKAGAKKCFFIKCDENSILEAFLTVYNNYCNDQLIICESNTLRKYVEPSIFAIVTSKNTAKIKPSAQFLLHYADFTIDTDNQTSIINNIPAISVINKKWNLYLENKKNNLILYKYFF